MTHPAEDEEYRKVRRTIDGEYVVETGTIAACLLLWGLFTLQLYMLGAGYSFVAISELGRYVPMLLSLAYMGATLFGVRRL